VNLTTLLLTLLEVAGGMAYLHRMGVVHCDLKPANVLLKSSSVDRRGFTAKISDFGLSRCGISDLPRPPRGAQRIIVRGAAGCGRRRGRVARQGLAGG
jgi:serine/threonine protein kinase